MKRSVFVGLLSLLLMACKEKAPTGANGVIYTTAIEYNDYIVSRQAILMRNLMAFEELMRSDPDSAEKILAKYTRDTEQMVREIRGMPAYKGDSALRDAAADIFGFYHRSMGKDYRDILHLQKEQDGVSMEIAEQVSAIVKKFAKEEKAYDDRFQSAQQAFAKKNNIELVENELQRKMEEKMKPGQ